MLKLLLLLYAYDIVIFADNIIMLQKGLEIYMIIALVGNYKTKIMVIRGEEFYMNRKLNVTFFQKDYNAMWGAMAQLIEPCLFGIDGSLVRETIDTALFLQQDTLYSA